MVTTVISTLRAAAEGRWRPRRPGRADGRDNLSPGWRRRSPNCLTAEVDEVGGLIRVERPKLVLLDLMLPGIGGIELMGEVAELSDLPVIFISGYGRDETISRA